jgi:hypothetical protein
LSLLFLCLNPAVDRDAHGHEVRHAQPVYLARPDMADVGEVEQVLRADFTDVTN